MCMTYCICFRPIPDQSIPSSAGLAAACSLCWTWFSNYYRLREASREGSAKDLWGRREPELTVLMFTGPQRQSCPIDVPLVAVLQWDMNCASLFEVPTLPHSPLFSQQPQQPSNKSSFNRYLLHFIDNDHASLFLSQLYKNNLLTPLIKCTRTEGKLINESGKLVHINNRIHHLILA